MMLNMRQQPLKISRGVYSRGGGEKIDRSNVGTSECLYVLPQSFSANQTLISETVRVL